MMRGKRERYFEDDDLEVVDRSSRHHGSVVPRERDARDAWEPIVCPHCGRDHQDTGRVRLRRIGNELEARCVDCGSVAARFVEGVWSA